MKTPTLLTSVADPDPNPDPYVFGPPGSGSISQMYGSGSFNHQAKIVRKTLISNIVTSQWLLSVKNDVNVPVFRIRIRIRMLLGLPDPHQDPFSQRCRSEVPDPHPDPYQNAGIHNTGASYKVRKTRYTSYTMTKI